MQDVDVIASTFGTLPIHAVLDALKSALRGGGCAVLVAAPGAGKTTVAPLALLDEPWAQGGKLIVLEPRRLAARAAARRMAQSLGQAVGARVGYRVRMESRVSAATRLEVVTEGVFTRMIQDDPTLEGVAGVVFDEFHERSVEGDLGLAFALESQALVRPDLRLLVMSATLDGAAVARLLGPDTPVIVSAGRSFPVETRHLPREAGGRIEDDVVRAVLRALAAEEGGVLVFLPGRGEIGRVEALLRERLDDPRVLVAPLYGGLDLAAQDAAIAPAPAGCRKVVLATSIAQTSLTLEDVRVVIDSGLARVPRHDPARGLTRLVTVPVSRAAAEQRRGRAGRTAPGVCLRLWEEAQTRSLPAFDRPEMLESDLGATALALAVWGARSAEGLALLDPPPAAAFAEARRLLASLDALDDDGDLTPHGRRLARLGLPPRLGHMVLEAATRGAGLRAAHLAAVLSEPGLGGQGLDLGERALRLARDGGARAAETRALAQRWSRDAGGEAAAPAGPRPSDGLLLAFAYPERIARARGAPGEFQLANGRGARLPATDALAKCAWLGVGELVGGGDRDRILGAAALDEAELLAAFGARIDEEVEPEVDAQGRARVVRTRRFGAIVVERRVVDATDGALTTPALLERLGKRGLGVLAWTPEATSLRARVAYLRALEGDAWPDLSDEALLADAHGWLGPLLAERFALEAIDGAALEAALRARIRWDLQWRLEREAPRHFVTPAGTSAPIDYAAEGGPRVEVRVQELFGLARHPIVGEARVPLTLALLSPARRPVQVTRDLPGFWAGSWREVRVEMKGRYPRHPWPEDPLQAPPTTRARPRS